MNRVQFLALAEVLEIHRDQTARYGGRGGIRDLRMLLSAMAVPQSTFDGVYLHTDLRKKRNKSGFFRIRRPRK